MARRPLTVFVVIAALAAGAAAAGAQLYELRGPDPPVKNIGYDGRLTFARIKYKTGPGGYYYYGLPAWAHGYPNAEHNLMSIVHEISNGDARVDGSNVLALDDPLLARYPVAYMVEAGYWTMTPREAAGLRGYLQKGGFIIFDDFREPRGWDNFEKNMQQAIPGARFVDIDLSDPIFHSFFEIASLQVPQFYDQGAAVFRALFEDNDPKKRLLAIVNFNTDVSNFWEFSATGLKPVSESNEAYKLGVNYFIYGVTH